MTIELKENTIPSINALITLYQDAGWINYTSSPKMLEAAYENSLYVLTAWEKQQLIGALRIVGDGFSIIYVQDLLVLKAKQSHGIGTQLLTRALTQYQKVYQKVLLTDQDSKLEAFYRKNGFSAATQYNCQAFVS